MIKFCAINDKPIKQPAKSDKDQNNDKSISEEVVKTQVEVFSKEKEECRIMNLYKESLEFQMKAQYEKVIDNLEEILTSSVMKENDLVVHLQVVKAVSFKILAKTYQKLSCFDSAFLFYQMAIKLNQPDINLWYGMGFVSEKLKHWEAAVQSYENVLKINKQHWPSLDALIIITFALSNFENCIELCENALHLDSQYEAAIYVLQKIFQFQPYLKTLYQNMLEELPNILDESVHESISCKVQERVDVIRSDLRAKLDEQRARDTVHPVNFPSTLKIVTWDSLTRAIVKMFQHLKESNRLECPINMASLLPDSAEDPISNDDVVAMITDSDVTGPDVDNGGGGVGDCGDVSAASQEKIDEKDYEVIEETEDNEPIDCSSTFSTEKTAVNAYRITRNSSQLFERPDKPAEVTRGQYLASLMRMNILSEVHDASSASFSRYRALVQTKREQANPHVDQQPNHQSHQQHHLMYRARSLASTDGGLERQVRRFVQSLGTSPGPIMAVAWRLEHELAKKEGLAWSAELLEDYLTLIALVRVHVSSQCPENGLETLLALRKTLFELEIGVDRKQSELEGRVVRQHQWREITLAEFLPHTQIEQLAERLMKLQVYHAHEFVAELNRIHIRILWVKYILADLNQDEEEARLILGHVKDCLADNDIAVVLRPNCVHYSLITPKKIEDCFSASYKSLKIDLLSQMYQNGEYRAIIDKMNLILGTVVMGRDDYAEDVNNYLIQISFLGASYHKLLQKMLQQAREEQDQHDQQVHVTAPAGPDKQLLSTMYRDIAAMLEEITSIMDILVDPKKKNRASLTTRQLGFLTENFFKVAEIVMTDATLLIYCLRHRDLDLIDVTSLGDVARFIVLAKEYFYYMLYHGRTAISVGHVSCLYEHFLCIELHDPDQFNQSVTCDPSEELDLPPSLNFLSLIHDFLGWGNQCGQQDGAVLKFIATAVSEYFLEIRPRFSRLEAYLANEEDVLSLLDQAVYCIRPIYRPHIDKFRRPIDHGCTDKISISMDLVDMLMPYLEPERIPEIDSLKSLSISTELNALLLEVIDLLPESVLASVYSEQCILNTIESESPLNFGLIHPSKYSRIFYFVADYYFKNNEFEIALHYYIKNLRFTPVCFDSWAAIALIYYKRFELKFNMMDSNSEFLDNEEVMKCLNCFNHAISLDPENLTILIERACFCYEVHSYASRIIKKSMTRDIRDSFVKVCEILASTMLELAKESYQMALDDNSYREDKEEKWLYHYMLSKCMEKSDENTIFDVLDNLKKALTSLDNCGARYVRRVVLYTKLPYRAVEAVEVYYKYHASVLKCLIKNQATLLQGAGQEGATRGSGGGPAGLKDRTFKRLDHRALLEIQQGLVAMGQSPFIVNVGKKPCARPAARKRTNPCQKPEDGIMMLEQPASKLFCQSSMEFAAAPIDLASIPPELRYDDTDDDCIIHEVVLPNQAEDTQSVFERCIDMCKNAMEVVLQRLPLHYKAMYHLANIFYSVNHLKDLDKSYEYLMGSCKTGKYTINGLFKDRKPSNFFCGVWRIPVADIDRYGSFAYHMYRSMNLLLTVLRQLNNWNDLIHVTGTLRKSASSDKKGFLSEADRRVLVRKSMGHALCSVTVWLMENKRADIDKAELLQVHTLYYLAIKQSQGIDKIRMVLVQAFNRCPAARELHKQMVMAASAAAAAASEGGSGGGGGGSSVEGKSSESAPSSAGTVTNSSSSTGTGSLAVSSTPGTSGSSAATTAAALAGVATTSADRGASEKSALSMQIIEKVLLALREGKK